MNARLHEAVWPHWTYGVNMSILVCETVAASRRSQSEPSSRRHTEREYPEIAVQPVPDLAPPPSS
jgi:hypothetical protein